MTATHFLAGLILVGTAAALSIPESAISGPARVIDGDTIEVNHQRIRLWGIDAPERDQPGGAQATAYLQRITLNESVSCNPRDTDRYHRIVAKCSVLGRDLGASLVSVGLAIDYTRYSHGFYRDEENAARQEKLGVWCENCSFMEPEKWRREHKTR
jgi:endonuclease YncB( thermonuclease family)